MAQTGYTPIQLYYSTTTSNVPSAGNLASGELAINITDGKLFYKDNGGVVRVIAQTSSVTNVASISFGTTGLTPSTATSGAVTVAGTLVAANGGTGQSTYTTGDLLYATGSTALSKLGIGTNGQILTSTGTAPQWSTLSGVAVTTFSAGTTGFTPSSATSGAVTLAGTLATTNGGTGLTSFTANRVFYASSTSAIGSSANLTFDGTTLTANALTTTSTVTINGGTANGVAYLNGSKVLTTGSALTFDGTTLANSSGGTPFSLNRTGAGTALIELKQSGTVGGYLGTSGSNDFIIFNGSAAELARFNNTGLGIGTSSPASKLSFGTGAQSTTDTANVIRLYDVGGTNGNNYGFGFDGVAGRFAYTAGTGGFHAWFTSNTERMRLDSSGNLGIGTSSPGARLEAASTTDGDTIRISFPSAATGTTGGGLQFRAWTNSATLVEQSRIQSICTDGSASYGADMRFMTANAGSLSEKMRLTSAGNLGLGVTPSAWTIFKPIELGAVGTYISGRSGSNQLDLGCNNYYNSGYKYASTGAATIYEQNAGAHLWYTAPSGTAGNAISFTQAMTLDASGNLGIGVTSMSYPLDVKLANNQFILAREATANTTNGFRIGGVNNEAKAVFSANSATGEVNLGANNTNYFLTFSTNGANERARITSGGYFKASNTGSYLGSTAAYHEFVSNNGDSNVLVLTNSNATLPYGLSVYFSGGAPNDATRTFLQVLDTGATRATIRSNGGIANFQANDVNLSDRREKTNFSPAKNYLDTICAIPVQTFNYIDQSEDDPGLTLGVVAQDVQAVAPELVQESNWGTEDNPKMRLSIYQTDLQYALMKCIQELKSELDTVKAELATLKGN